MSLTINDLPGILADLARLEPERFRPLAINHYPDCATLRFESEWVTVRTSADAQGLGLVQAAVQEAIVARKLAAALVLDSLGSRAVVDRPEVVCRYLDSEADGFYHDRWLWANLPAIALAGAYRDALLAQQEPA